MRVGGRLMIVLMAFPQLGVYGQNIQLSIERDATLVRVTYLTSADYTYELQQSSGLDDDWQLVGTAKAGDGQPATYEIAAMDPAAQFYRLLITERVQELAPSQEMAVELFVGTTLEGYAFVSATRFHWFGEGGEWTYEKTGSDTACIVFTYDEDGNNPQVYREEVILTFTTPTSGSYRYSEFNFGVEDPGSVGTAPFTLKHSRERAGSGGRAGRTVCGYPGVGSVR